MEASGNDRPTQRQVTSRPGHFPHRLRKKDQPQSVLRSQALPPSNVTGPVAHRALNPTPKSASTASCSSPVLDYLEHLHREFAPLTEGHLATYIPELAKANPEWFGICLVTANGTAWCENRVIEGVLKASHSRRSETKRSLTGSSRAKRRSTTREMQW